MIRYNLIGHMYKHSRVFNMIDDFVRTAQTSSTPTDLNSSIKIVAENYSAIRNYLTRLAANKISFKDQHALTEQEKIGVNVALKAINSFSELHATEDGLLASISEFYNGIGSFKIGADRYAYDRKDALLGPINGNIKNIETVYNSLKGSVAKPKDKPKYNIDQQASYIVNMFNSFRSKLKIDENSPYDSTSEDKSKDQLVVAYRKTIDSFTKIFSKLPIELSLPDSYKTKEDVEITNKYSLAKMKAEDFINKSTFFVGNDMKNDPSVLTLKDLLSKVPDSSGVKSVVSSDSNSLDIQEGIMNKFSSLTDKINIFYKKAQEQASDPDVANVKSSLSKFVNIVRDSGGNQSSVLTNGYALCAKNLDDDHNKIGFVSRVNKYISNTINQVEMHLNDNDKDKLTMVMEEIKYLTNIVLNPQLKNKKPIPEFLETIKSVLDRIASSVQLASTKTGQEKDRLLNESKSMLSRLNKLVLTASSAYSSSYPSKTDKVEKLEKMLSDFSLLMNLKLGAEYLKTLKPSVDVLVSKVNEGKNIKSVDKATEEQVRDFGKQKSYL